VQKKRGAAKRARPAQSKSEVATSEPKRKATPKPTVRRRRLRAELWPDSEWLHYDRKVENGFITIPRTLSLVATLIRSLTKSVDASKVYVDLWCRSYDEGFVTVDSEMEFAVSCGYEPNSRCVRSWQERMKELERLGFILVKSRPGRKYGYVLLVHPHYVVEKMHDEHPELVPAHWWEVYQDRVRAIGAKSRPRELMDRHLRGAKGELEAESTAGEIELT
jgi:hypothetical protein